MSWRNNRLNHISSAEIKITLNREKVFSYSGWHVSKSVNNIVKRCPSANYLSYFKAKFIVCTGGDKLIGGVLIHWIIENYYF